MKVKTNTNDSGPEEPPIAWVFDLPPEKSV
jgi:hypothetical protein